MRIILVCAAMLLICGSALAVPRMSLPAGSPCATCHLNSNGGGGRNQVGWETSHKMGAVNFDWWVRKNTVASDRISLGFDSRIQFVHLGRPRYEQNDDGQIETVNPDFKAIPMQLQPEIGIKLTNWLSITGQYNPGPDTSSGKICDPVFAGQSCFESAVIIKPRADLEIRTGMIQPAIGIRPDDHTVYVRSDANDLRRPIIAANYAEWGAEMTYHPVSWFRVEVGGFHTGRLDTALNGRSETADIWPTAYSGRFSFMPRWDFGGPQEETDDSFDDFDDDEPQSGPPLSLNTWIGASILGSGDFYFLNGFLGAGLSNNLEVRFDVSRSMRTIDYVTLNSTVTASWAILDWLVPTLRVDRAQTDLGDETKRAWQYVAGFEFFPVPFVEIRPEYRVVKTGEYLFGQPTVQLHFFF